MTAQPDAKPARGAGPRRNNRRHDDAGRSLRKECNDGRSNIRKDRHPPPLPALGANEHLAGSPVDIIQGEGRDLVSPQAELRQHHEDGVVPPPQRRRSIATIEDLAHLRGRQIGRQARELPSPDGAHTAGQSEWVQPSMMEVSEKCAQRPAHRFPGPRAPIPGMALDVADDGRLADPAAIAGTSGHTSRKNRRITGR